MTCRCRGKRFLSGMIRGGFLDPNIRADLIALVRDGKAETRLTRRANALLLLDDGMSCEAIAKVLYLDDDTIRYWYQLYGEKGLIWLADFGYQGRACELTAAQQDGLKDWVAQTLPRTSTTVGEWIEKSYGVSYTRSALVKLPNFTASANWTNPRSREVWRQTAGENGFRVSAGASQCGGLCAKPVVSGLLCTLQASRECWSRNDWRPR